MFIIKLDSSTYFRSMHRGRVVGCEKADAKQYVNEDDARAECVAIRKLEYKLAGNASAQIRKI